METSTQATSGLEIVASRTSSPADFDFLIGRWRFHNRKLKTRLNGCTDWLDFESRVECRKILNGFGNIDTVKFDFEGSPAEALALRLFNPKTRLWSIYWADSDIVTLDIPMVGSFDSHVGKFYARDVWEGNPVVVQFVWDKSNPDAPVWSQAFSTDEGKSWEWNWYMNFSRIN